MGIEGLTGLGGAVTAEVLSPAQYLTFAVGEEVFAMDITTMREIIFFPP